MPSSLHEVLIELFRQCPALVARLLVSAFGMDLPEYRDVRVEPGDFADVVPAQYQADTVVVFSDDARPVLAVVVEAQLRRDEGKRWSWPVYVATLRGRHRGRPGPDHLLHRSRPARRLGTSGRHRRVRAGSVQLTEPLFLPNQQPRARRSAR